MKKDEIRLHINKGSPETFPLDRLIDYLDCLRKFINYEDLHLTYIENGSTTPVISTDTLGIKHVHGVLNTPVEELSKAQIKAYNQLNNLLIEDETSVDLIIGDVTFECYFNRQISPQLPEIVLGHSSIQGTLIEVSSTKELQRFKLKILTSQNETITGEIENKQTAQQLGKLILKDILIHGQVEWEEDLTNNDWKITKFVVENWDELEENNLKLLTDTLRKTTNNPWDQIDDVPNFIAKIRG
ncbi:MAG: hypothetical protein H7Z73_11250 [Candidatus Saccharibacteria bacterium]|nr:hypothetical protein [Moraxellaceae bacterium]